MFHVKQSPDSFFIKYKAFLNNGGALNNCTPNFLISFLSSTEKPTCVYIEDSLFSLIHEQNQLSWDKHKVIWIPPKSTFLDDIPVGFNSLYGKSIGLLKTVSSSLWGDVKLVVCSASQQGLKIPISPSRPFVVNKDSEYDLLIDFLSNNQYHSVDLVVDKFQFSIRGALVDFFPPTSDVPIRVGFYGDDAVLHKFDINTQATAQKIEDFKVSTNSSDGRDTLLSSLIKDTFNVFYLDGERSLSKKIGSFEEIDFPYNELTFDLFIENYRDSYNVLNYNCLSGFVSSRVAWVPPWFLKDGFAVKLDVHKKIIKNSFSYTDLHVGDYIVHQDCGVGLFRGSKVLEDDDGGIQELLVLEYLNGGLVSLDINYLHKLSHFASADTEGVVLDSLNKKGLWENKKKSAKKQANEVVESLLSAYALRTNITRPPFVEDKQIEALFINQFPYEETIDQKHAWKEISNDMGDSSPMDRLLCGDVGFGKTEIAIRTAFRAILNGKLVLVLAPTTILAQQLEGSFKNRLKSFGARVNSVSRFKTKGEVQKIKEAWSAGKIDILVGTHVVLYDDIYLNNVALIIVDEEHRFGVKQKEKIRAIKHTIDVLSMSATPIPRTLNLALAGIREISTLNTPPKSRLPIETQISYLNDTLIKTAILNEKYRNGQLFFVHNDVKTLPNYVAYLQKLLPAISIDIINGQMPSRQIELVMNRFINKEIDVLVCTSIIETGIDIANANTVIINNAQQFGLSQLYQIRGRVGRGIRQAYAYLLLPQGRILKNDVYKRLKAIEENTHLGAGYNISNMDLEIRGAGAVFGYKQSGGVGRVGFELYSLYIKEVLARLRENKVPDIFPQDVIVNIHKNTIIPEEYISSPSIRISFYRKLSSVVSIENINDIENELIDRFGPTPASIRPLINFWKIRVVASTCGILSLEKSNGILSIILCQSFLEHSIDLIFKHLPGISKDLGWGYQFKPQKNNNLCLLFNLGNSLEISSKVLVFMDKLRTIIKL
jgi:transcription-repair coupling factor (superfamily II helicase)